MHFLDLVFLNLVAFLFSASFGICLSIILGIEFKFSDLSAKLVIWIGLGLSIIPILGYWLYLFEIEQSLFIFLIFLSILSTTALIRLYLNRENFEISFEKFSIIAIFLAFLYSLLIFREMYGNYIPQSSDYSFHTLLVKNIMLNESIGNSWPFFGIDIRYPQGSHLFSALVIKLTNLDPIQSTIGITTFFAAYSLLGIYTMSNIFLKSYRQSLMSLICCGFLFPIFDLSSNQMIYWGGFSVLYGVALIPIFIFSLNLVFKSKKIENIIFCSIIFAAIVFSHPFSAIYVLLFWIPYLIYGYIKDHNFNFIINSIFIGFFTFILSSPYVLLYMDDFLSSTEDSGELDYREKRFDEVTFDLDIFVQIIVFIGLLFSFLVVFYFMKRYWRHDFFEKNSIFLFWTLLLIILGSNMFFKLKITFWYYLRPKYFFQATFIPLSVICGYLLSETYNLFKRNLSIALTFAITIFGGLSIYFGSDAQVNLNEADKDALIYLKNITNESDVILNDNVGLWIPAYIDREVYFMHLPESDDFYTMYRRKKLYDQIRENSTSEEILNTLNLYNITYIYMSRASNPNHYSELKITEDILSKNSNFTLIYQKNNVTIYRNDNIKF